MVPLNFSDIGEENIIKKITGGLNTKKRLSHLGFVVGGKVTVLNKTEKDLIVCVKDARVGVGKELARRIMI